MARYISKKTEEELLGLAKNGDTDAIMELHKMHEGIIMVFIKRYIQPPFVRYNDLLQESYITLMRAIKRYDSEKNIKFITFLTFLLKRDLYTYAMSTSHISMPMNKKLKLAAMQRKKHNDDDFTIDEDDAKHIEALFADKLYDVYDTLESADTQDDTTDLNMDLNNALAKLEKSHWSEIIILKYGLNGERPHTMKEIGDKFGKTKQWAHAEITKGLKKLKNTNGHLREYL